MSNSNPFKPASIEEKGLKEHLDSTAEIHNNWGYDAFVKMVGDDPEKPDVNKANLARAFKVDRQTINKWLEIYKKS